MVIAPLAISASRPMGVVSETVDFNNGLTSLRQNRNVPIALDDVGSNMAKVAAADPLFWSCPMFATRNHMHR